MILNVGSPHIFVNKLSRNAQNERRRKIEAEEIICRKTTLWWLPNYHKYTYYTQ